MTLSEEAVSTALARAERLTDELINKIATLNPALLSEFQSPGMQLALFSAQKECARTGDETVEQLLVSVLVDRAKERERSLRQIALEEAITVIPKLTEKQIDILTLNTLVNDHYFSARSLPALKSYLSRVMQFKATIRFMSPDIRHVEFTGCAKLTTSSRNKSLDMKIKESFPGLFPKEFTKDEFITAIPRSEEFEALLVPCDSKEGYFRLNAVSIEDINQFFQLRNLNNDDKKPLFDLLRSASLDIKDVKARLIELEPGIEFVFSFDNHDIFSLELTPVGMAIASANFARKMGYPLGWPYHMRDV